MQQSLWQDNSHDAGCKRVFKLPADVSVRADIDGPYRYSLEHRWGSGSLCMFLMMNPSAADWTQTDATVNKVSNFARRWGYSGVLIGNVCAYRSKEKNNLIPLKDPVGPRNVDALLEMGHRADRIIVAHGKLPGKLQEHATVAVRTMDAAGFKLWALRLSKDGTPWHPLYLPDDTLPIECKPK